MKKTALIFTLLLLISIASWAQDPVRVKITEIHDGDTLTAVALKGSQRYKIRLLGVDTPEVDFSGQNQGAAALLAKAALEELLPLGIEVEISSDSDIDKHGRVLGRILKDSLDINKEMLRQGWGFFYFIYPFEKRLLTSYSEAFEEAVVLEQGLFALKEATEEPYLFRMRVSNLKGKNFVGNLKTKELFHPEDILEIPLWLRVFFPDQDFAHRVGYKLRP